MLTIHLNRPEETHLIMKRLILGIMVMAWGHPSFAEQPLEVAKRAAATIGLESSGSCNSCHAVNSRRTMLRWAANAMRVKECMNPEGGKSPLQQLNCIAYTKDDQKPEFAAYQFGFYAAGLHLSEFQNLLHSAYDDQEVERINANLKDSSRMPFNGQPLTEAQFADIRAWYEGGLPHLDEILNIEPGPSSCEASVSPEFKDHLIAASKDNWQTRNVEHGMRMFACSDGGCFQQKRNGKEIFPEVCTLENAADWKADPATHMHLLYETSQETSYWVRSSADGRFVAYGGNPSGIIDLQSTLLSEDPTRIIKVNAFYDPAFFPDDSAFMFQGNLTGLCTMSLLKDRNTTHVTFQEDACSVQESHRIPLYQAVGASLDGSDYLAATGSFNSDPGSGNPERASLGRGSNRDEDESQLFLYPILYDGQQWIRRDPQIFQTPWEIDWGMSPSNRLLLGRRQGVEGNGSRHQGYNVYELKRPSESEPYEKKPMARICLDGLKANFSFDDRFLVTYSYIKPDQFQALGFKSADDAAFKKLLDAGTSNVFIYDFWTQKTTTVTHMGPNQFAQFPHFRSDGWLYFEVYDSVRNRRQIMASDVAVRMTANAPTR